MPRVLSSLWVGAYLRRCQVEGAFAAVVRRGAGEAGAIFVKINRLDGTVDLYGPAPQAMVEPGEGIDRQFERLGEKMDEAAANARLARESSFDPDLWIVEIEDRAGRAFLDLAPGA